IFAVAAYAGLRRGEIEALRWSAYRDGELHVEYSIWSGKIGTPKSKSSKAAVPVIRQLAERLEIHRLRCGDPAEGWIFSTSEQTPFEPAQRREPNHSSNPQPLPSLWRDGRQSPAALARREETVLWFRARRTNTGVAWLPRGTARPRNQPAPARGSRQNHSA